MLKKEISFFYRTSNPYYIVAPGFRQNSCGIRVLHYLCHALNEAGFEAYIATDTEVTSPFLRTPKLTQEIRAKHQASGCIPIGVYPEVVIGNILNLPVVARWILNKPGHLGGQESFDENEILFYWDEWVIDKKTTADRLNIPFVDRRIFHEPKTNTQRQGFCYYAHKYLRAGNKINPEIQRNGTSLCQDVPRSHEEIAEILRASKVLYCYEPTALATEAVACGCQVIYVDTEYLNQFNWENRPIIRIRESEISSFPIPELDMKSVNSGLDNQDYYAWKKIKNFIDKTQAAAKAHAKIQNTPEYKLKEAIKKFHNNEIEPAMNALAPLLDALPENPLPPAYLAFICAAQGLPQEAREFMDRAMEIAPDRADLKAALGESFLKAGQPGLAAEYLQEALQLQPDMLSAYPALARSLHLTQQSDTALALLKGAAHMPSSAQAHIQTTLLEILAEQGNIAEFSQACLRYSKGLADDLLAVRCLARFDASGEALVEALEAAQARLASELPELKQTALPLKASPPWKIAFLTSDFAREAQQGRLKALLDHLPPEQFVTTLIINDPQASLSHFAQVCSLVADHTLVIHDLDDRSALECLNANPADILIDLDCYGPADRLSLFMQAQAGIKLLWGEAPMPALATDCLPLQGELIADQAMLPGIILPGLGECCELPELPITPAPDTATLGCLTPAIRIGPEGWRLFAEVLLANPESQLLLNLKDLGDSAQAYITRQFTQSGIAASRLRFVHAHTREALCHYWQEVQLGLAPPVDAGDQALNTCLWMGRPFVALAANLPWSHRPAALLHCAGASAWVADSATHYVELASRPPRAPDPGLRERLRAAGLNDPAAFARGFAATMADLMQAAHATRPSP